MSKVSGEIIGEFESRGYIMVSHNHDTLNPYHFISKLIAKIINAARWIPIIGSSINERKIISGEEGHQYVVIDTHTINSDKPRIIRMKPSAGPLSSKPIAIVIVEPEDPALIERIVAGKTEKEIRDRIECHEYNITELKEANEKDKGKCTAFEKEIQELKDAISSKKEEVKTFEQDLISFDKDRLAKLLTKQTEFTKDIRTKILAFRELKETYVKDLKENKGQNISLELKIDDDRANIELLQTQEENIAEIIKETKAKIAIGPDAKMLSMIEAKKTEVKLAKKSERMNLLTYENEATNAAIHGRLVKMQQLCALKLDEEKALRELFEKRPSGASAASHSTTSSDDIDFERFITGKVSAKQAYTASDAFTVNKANEKKALEALMKENHFNDDVYRQVELKGKGKRKLRSPVIKSAKAVEVETSE
ncbi:MAG: hypothetical protein K1060chlam3_00318 [Candidatus Anoxychlamydiales bacterium]|nr:hypothetical protein [Candidatus Anoxychlamydiales bacterium]